MHVYLLIFGAVFSTLILPLPEELALLGAGYSARRGDASLAGAFFAAWAGIMLGDWITFFTGRTLLPRLLKSRWGRKLIKPDWQEWATGFVQSHGTRAIVLGRFLVALRGPVYLAIGAAKFSRLRFLVTNGLVGLAEVALVVGTGYVIGPAKESAHRLRVVDYCIAGAIVLITIVIPIVFKRVIDGKKKPRAHHGHPQGKHPPRAAAHGPAARAKAAHPKKR